MPYPYTGYQQPFTGYQAQPGYNPSTYLPQPQNQPVQPRLSCQPVASIEEAKAIPTDFSGVTQVFTDFAHGCIYVKSLNYQTGAADFKIYALAPDVPVAPMQDFVPRQEFDTLKNLVETLKKQIGGMNNEPESNVSRRNSKPNGNDAK